VKNSRAWFLTLLLGSCLALTGCNKDADSKPNPDLKIPDITPVGPDSKEGRFPTGTKK
jgi:hypothetical protein